MEDDATMYSYDSDNFKTVECSQVAQVVRSMSLNKSPGIDKLPTRVIKDSLPAILPVIKISNKRFAY